MAYFQQENKICIVVSIPVLVDFALEFDTKFENIETTAKKQMSLSLFVHWNAEFQAWNTGVPVFSGPVWS